MGSGCCDWARLALPQLSVTGGCAGQMGGWSVGGLETHGDKEQDLQKSLCKRGRHRRFGQEVAGGGRLGGCCRKTTQLAPELFCGVQFTPCAAIICGLFAPHKALI